MHIRIEATNKVFGRFGGMSLVAKVARTMGLAKNMEGHVPSQGFVGETT